MSKSLIGERFGKLTVIDWATPSASGAIRWLCRCDCGNEKIVAGSNLRNGNTKSCGCARREKKKDAPKEEKAPVKAPKEVKPPRKKIDLTGQRFGRLTVLKEVDPYISPSGTKQRRWLCQCDCGTQKAVNQAYLLSGSTKSCGCSKKQKSPGEEAPKEKVPHERIDLTGQRFGRWTVLEEAPTKKKDWCTVRYWHCRCDCGTEKDVAQSGLTSGQSKSCGCYRREKFAEGRAKLERNREERAMAKASQKKIDYNAEYNKKNYANVSFRAKPEEVEALKEAAKESGKSLSRYILDCCAPKK